MILVIRKYHQCGALILDSSLFPGGHPTDWNFYGKGRPSRPFWAAGLTAGYHQQQQGWEWGHKTAFVFRGVLYIFVQPTWTDAKLLNLLAWQAREDCVNLPGTVDEYKEADDLENPGLTSSVGHLDSNLDKVLTLTIIDPSLDPRVIVGSVLGRQFSKPQL